MRRQNRVAAQGATAPVGRSLSGLAIPAQIQGWEVRLPHSMYSKDARNYRNLHVRSKGRGSLPGLPARQNRAVATASSTLAAATAIRNGGGRGPKRSSC